MVAKTILDRIMLYKREELPKRKRYVPESDLRAALFLASPTRDFAAALRAPGVSLIAECKKASPSRGLLRNGYDAAALAKEYEANGASAISVLTDAKFFQGKIEDLVAVRTEVQLPVLRKDFIFDPYQLLEARVAGADAVLLIAALLLRNTLRDMRVEAERLGMQALIEVHDEAEVEHALDSGATIIGVNNRDLRYFEVDFGTTGRLRPLIPADRLLVAESGINSPEDVRQLAAMGADAMLVGERLVRSKEAGARVWELVNAGR
ncbi:MAG: indole-3-glycerol phosphate synthase TrpC [Ardenticatenales bacterium]|nr:indole-3-glycerol phosphate synthase TrpC [Ardenticatenales bacterium]